MHTRFPPRVLLNLAGDGDAFAAASPEGPPAEREGREGLERRFGGEQDVMKRLHDTVYRD